MSVHTIKLEFLRQGPPTNQLLSPLTPYLAIVGQTEATTVHLPYDQREFIRDLRVLRYGAGPLGADDGVSLTDLSAIADKVSRIFGEVPGLLAELARRDATRSDLVHLRLVFSAAELALLPLELATAPMGFPGAGKTLCLQPDLPLVVTREIRDASGRLRRWPRQPRVLFASASPPGFEPVPTEAHLQALMRGLLPWSGHPIAALETKAQVAPLGPDERSGEERLRELITVLPHASLEDIEQACKATEYTHVHILAHGAEYDEDGQSMFALALHDGAGGSDLVTGDRLAVALRTSLSESCDGRSLSQPAVVSLAACDSANQGQVVLPGGSLAHVLHAAGIPLVIASQFPLSYEGSVILAETLYGGLLAAKDPRTVLLDVRRQLKISLPDRHDWASLVAYASFPDDLDAQIQEATYRAADSAIQVAMLQADQLIRLRNDETGGSTSGDGESDEEGRQNLEQITKIIQNIETSGPRMPQAGEFTIEGRGILASRDKRVAELHFKAALGTPAKQARQLHRDSIVALESARDRYRDAARYRVSRHDEAFVTPAGRLTVPSLHWVLTQWMCLDTVLGRPLAWDAWYAAKFSASEQEHVSEDLTRVWAHATLLELYLLAGAGRRPLDGGLTPKVIAKRALEHAGAVKRAGGFFARSTGRQLRRYVNWWYTKPFHDALRRHDAAAAQLRLGDAFVIKLGKQLLQELGERTS